MMTAAIYARKSAEQSVDEEQKSHCTRLREKRQRRSRTPAARSLLLAVVLAACGSDVPNLSSNTPTQSTLDAGAALACRRFAPLAQDVDAGRLTNGEFRQGMREVYEQARVYPNSEVTALSGRVVQILTSGGTDQDLREAFLKLVTACGK